MPKKNRSHGHYCKICGQYKANEKFLRKGHAAHICKACSKLSAAEKAEGMTKNRLTARQGRSHAVRRVYKRAILRLRSMRIMPGLGVSPTSKVNVPEGRSGGKEYP